MKHLHDRVRHAYAAAKHPRDGAGGDEREEREGGDHGRERESQEQGDSDEEMSGPNPLHPPDPLAIDDAECACVDTETGVSMRQEYCHDPLFLGNDNTMTVTL
jgi:hypothetical protein